MIEIEILSPDQNVWARSMALIEDPHVVKLVMLSSQIQYNCYAMPKVHSRSTSKKKVGKQ